MSNAVRMVMYGWGAPKGWSSHRTVFFRLALPLAVLVARRMISRFGQRSSASSSKATISNLLSGRLTLRPQPSGIHHAIDSKTNDKTPDDEKENDYGVNGGGGRGRASGAVSAALMGLKSRVPQAEAKRIKFQNHVAWIVAAASFLFSFRSPFWWKIVYLASLICFLIVN